MAPGAGKVACPAGTPKKRSSSSHRRRKDAAPSGVNRASIANAPKTTSRNRTMARSETRPCCTRA
eukprot:14462620-Heterocapsa_arctica.AAC.1